MVVHLECAGLTNGAVVGAVRLETLALVAVAHSALHAPLLHRAGHLGGGAGQHGLPLILGLGGRQVRHSGSGKKPVLGHRAYWTQHRTC